MSRFTKREVMEILIKLNFNFEEMISNFNAIFNDEEKEHIVFVLEEMDIETRICSVCGKIIYKGHLLFDGDEYACSDECLNQLISEDEYDDSCYETDWTELDSEGKILGGMKYVMLFNKWIDSFLEEINIPQSRMIQFNVGPNVFNIELKLIINNLKAISEIDKENIKMKILREYELGRIDILFREFAKLIVFGK